MRNLFRVHLIFLSILILTSCSLKKVATTTIGKVAVDGIRVIEREEDFETAHNSTLPLILMLEVLSQGNTKDKRMQMLLAKSYGQYSFGFLEEDLIRYKNLNDNLYDISLKKAKLFYKRGKDHGLNSLWSAKEQGRVLSLPQDEFEKELRRFGKKKVANLFWTAFCWGNWINLNRDDPGVLIDTPRVEAMMKRVINLEPSYYYGSAHTFLGAMASARPKMLGGDYEKSREEFEAAIKIDDSYLMHKVLFAQFYAVQTQNKNLFLELLKSVQEANIEKDDEKRLANELAKRRAFYLTEKIKVYF